MFKNNLFLKLETDKVCLLFCKNMIMHSVNKDTEAEVITIGVFKNTKFMNRI